MKKKDMIYLVLAVGILLVAGYVGYTQLVPQKAGSAADGVKVEVVGVIPSEMDATGLTRISDVTKVLDYSSPLDLTGLNNAVIFGP